MFILFMLTVEWVQRFELHGLVLHKIKSRVWRWSVYLFLLMAIFFFGGGIESEVKKCVMMVMPHTSNHDFYLGVFTRGIVGLEMNWIGKKELFMFPFNYYFKYMGGEPLDRSGGLNKVDAIRAPLIPSG
jgi:1-acyl-sn-glycerol-3-phosphate acyltransferase